jgi:hypothetical protein
MTKSPRRPLRPFGPRASELMSAHLTLHHSPEFLDTFVAGFLRKYPTLSDAEAGFEPEMLGTDVDLNGPFSRTPELKAFFLREFSRLSPVQQRFMKKIHLDNYYSGVPKPMAFTSGATDIAGGEVLMSVASDDQDVERMLVTVLCEDTSSTAS